CEFSKESFNRALFASPELLPASYPQVSPLVVVQKVLQAPQHAVQHVRANLSKQTRLGLEDICTAAWKDLVRFPLGEEMFKRIGKQQTKLGQSFGLSCLQKQIDQEEKFTSSMVGLCLASAAGSLFMPPLGLGAGA